MISAFLLLLSGPTVRLSIHARPGDVFNFRSTITAAQFGTVYSAIRLTCKSVAPNRFDFVAQTSGTEQTWDQAVKGMRAGDRLSVDLRGRVVDVKSEHIKGGFGVVLPEGPVQVGARWVDKSMGFDDQYELAKLEKWKGRDAAKIIRRAKNYVINIWVERSTGFLLQSVTDANFGKGVGYVTMERVFSGR